MILDYLPQQEKVYLYLKKNIRDTIAKIKFIPFRKQVLGGKNTNLSDYVSLLR